MRKRSFGLGFMFMATMLAGGTITSQAAVPVTNQNAAKKDAIRQDHRQAKPQSERRKNDMFSSENPYKHNRKGFLDQPEKRKKLRSNHHFARSKKCTTKR